MSQTKAQLIDNLVSPITGALGSASAPTFSFTADPNTGIYSPGADQLAISTGGSGRLFVDASGNVGVGTNSPLALYRSLSIAGPATDEGGVFETRTSNSSTVGYFFSDSGGVFLQTATAHPLTFRTNNTERLRITSAGLVGIGTSAPSTKLEISGNEATANFIVATNTDAFAWSGFRLRNTGTSGRSYDIGLGGNSSGASTAGNFYVYDNTAGAQRITLDSSGRVGIGTTSPNASDWNANSQVLHIYKNTTEGSILKVESSNAVGVFAGGNGLVAVGSTSNDPLQFRVNVNEVGRFDTSGRLLVGTSSSSASTRLVVQANSSSSSGTGSIYLLRGNANPTSGQNLTEIQMGNGNANMGASIVASCDGNWTDGSDQPTRLVFSTTANGAASPTERLRIDSSGRVGIGTTSPGMKLTINDTTTAQIQLGYNDSIYGRIGRNSSGNYEFSSYENGGNLLFGTTGTTGSTTERARIDSSGRVGIGTSDTSSNNILLSLKANSAITIPGVLLEDSGASGRKYGIYSAGGTFSFRDYTAGENRLVIDSSGRCGIGSNSPQAPFVVSNGGAQGVEAGWSAGSSSNYVQSYNRSTSAFIQLDLVGSPLVFKSGATEAARIDGGSRLLVGTTSSTGFVAPGESFTTAATVQVSGSSASGASSLQVTDTVTGDYSLGGSLFLNKRRSDNVGNPGGHTFGSILFAGWDTAALRVGASIKAAADGSSWTSGSCPSKLVFSTTADGASSPSERLRIDSAGNLLFNTTSLIDVSNFSAVIKPLTNFATIKAPDTNTYMAFQFQNNSGTRVGYIQFSTTATTFSTSSDYRLKENVVAVNDGITRLQQLKPRRFNFIADPNHTVDGFLAHEVQDIVPESIQGIKDAVDAEGKPVYQGIDQSKLVPLLTAALQEAIGEIESLKARLTAAGI
jgi:hypothetical protein